MAIMESMFAQLTILLSLSLFLYSGQVQAQPEFFAKIRALKTEGKLEPALLVVNQQISTLRSMPTTEIIKDEIRLLTMEQGLLLLDLNQLEKAESIFKNILESETNLMEYAHYQLAQIALKKGQPLEAQKEFKAILKLSPNMKMLRDSQFQLSKIQNDQKQFKEARTILAKLEKKNRHEEIYPELIYELARAERGVGNKSGFCRWAKKLYAHYPDDSHVSTWGFNLSENSFEQLATKCSTNSDDRHLRIKNLQWAGLNKKAREEIVQLKQGSKEDQVEAVSLEITFLLHDGEVEAAMELLKPMYESKKVDANFLMLIANAAAKLGDSEAAIGSYYAAYRRNSRGKFGKQALFQAAFVSYQFQDYDGASRKFQEFMKAFAGSPLTRDAKWYLAWIRYLRGDYEGAYKSLTDLRTDSKKVKKSSASISSDRMNYWLGMCLFRMARYSESRVIFESLSHDKLLGYYSWAAAARLKKLDEIMPKISQRILPDENRRVIRSFPLEALMPADDPAWFREIAAQQSELNDFSRTEDSSLKQIGEEAESAPELVKEEGPDRGDDVTEEKTASSVEGDDNAIVFSKPVLLKRFERARNLMILGLQEWSRWDLFDIEKRTSNREYLKTLMQEYELAESYNRSSYIGQVTFASQRAFYGLEGIRPLWEQTYPRAFSGVVNRYSLEFNVPTELIWGIMRAESQYKRDVVSPVGALGLMQVMPFTAQKVAGLLGEKNFDSKKLLQPEGAVKIGAKYLQRLIKKFDGNFALVAAGYNAGPHRVRSWITSFGQLDLDEFVEHIPYVETRNYVKKVLTHFLIYSRLYNGKKEGMITLSGPLGGLLNESILSSKENSHETMKESWDDI